MTTQMSREEIARRGEEIYATRLRGELEGAHDGQVVIIDVETDEYEVGDDSLAANRRALEKHPGAILYAVRVGYEAVESLHGGPRRTKR